MERQWASVDVLELCEVLQACVIHKFSEMNMTYESLRNVMGQYLLCVQIGTPFDLSVS